MDFYECSSESDQKWRNRIRQSSESLEAEMKFSTNFSTTIFSSSFPLLFHELKAGFLPLLIVEGGIYGGYKHQSTFKALISSLKKPVFVVVLFVVLFLD